MVKSEPIVSYNILNKLLRFCYLFYSKYILRVGNNLTIIYLIFIISSILGSIGSPTKLIDIVLVFMLSIFYLLNVLNTAH